MKTINFFVLFILITSILPVAAQNSEWETYELLNSLLSMRSPGEPVIHDDYVIFTADSSLRRVGISFAHENFNTTYWFQTLLISQDRLNPILLPGEKEPSPYMDSGIKFYVYNVPAHIKDLEYRLVINGLWTIDPLNPLFKRDPVSGLSLSYLRMPSRSLKPNPLNGLPDGLIFTYNAQPGESVTIAGSFNSWDPFMYELREGPSGVYSITIPLPPGTYQYVFIHRGQRYVDPNNPKRIYARDGSIASEIAVP